MRGASLVLSSEKSLRVDNVLVPLPRMSDISFRRLTKMDMNGSWFTNQSIFLSPDNHLL